MDMTLEKQVSNLELSKRLKELRVKQESLFYWMPPYKNYGWRIQRCGENIGGWNKFEPRKADISAFTVAELGEMLRKSKYSLPLPAELWSWDWTFNVSGQPKGYGNEAGARAELLIYLIENNLMVGS